MIRSAILCILLFALLGCERPDTHANDFRKVGNTWQYYPSTNYPIWTIYKGDSNTYIVTAYADQSDAVAGAISTIANRGCKIEKVEQASKGTVVVHVDKECL